ncbi:MAG TPA: hypothetical protein PL009_11040 [Flavipsychrobacter sp.]|nr:hypothetical protein [Flavipsychrobacter sp.]
MTATQSLKIYEILQRHFKSADDAKIVVEQIEQIVAKKLDDKKDILLTKDDKVELINKLDLTKTDLLNKMDGNFKWMIGVMLTLFGIVIGLLLKIIS